MKMYHRELDGDLYLMQSGDTNRYKIGYSENPPHRTCQLQIGSPDELNIRFSCRGDRIIEHIFHRRYEAKKIRGEWFTLSEEDLTIIKDEMEVFNYVLEDGNRTYILYFDLNANITDYRVYVINEIFKLTTTVKYAKIMKYDAEYAAGKYDRIDRAVDAGKYLNRQLNCYQNILDDNFIFEDIVYPDVSKLRSLAGSLLTLNNYSTKQILKSLSIIVPPNFTRKHIAMLPSRERGDVYQSIGDKRLYTMFKKILLEPKVIQFGPDKEIKLWQLLCAINIIGELTISKGTFMGFMKFFRMENPEYNIVKCKNREYITYRGLCMTEKEPSERSERPDTERNVLSSTEISEQLRDVGHWSHEQFRYIYDNKLLGIITTGKEIDILSSVKLTNAILTQHIYMKINNIKSLYRTCLSFKNDFTYAIVMDIEYNMQDKCNNMEELIIKGDEIIDTLGLEIKTFETNILNFLPIYDIECPNLIEMREIIFWFNSIRDSKNNFVAYMNNYKKEHLIVPEVRMIRTPQLTTKSTPNIPFPIR